MVLLYYLSVITVITLFFRFTILTLFIHTGNCSVFIVHIVVNTKSIYRNNQITLYSIVESTNFKIIHKLRFSKKNLFTHWRAVIFFWLCLKTQPWGLLLIFCELNYSISSILFIFNNWVTTTSKASQEEKEKS